MMRRDYEIEDRRERPSGYGAGKWVLWQIITAPFPARLAVGVFELRKQADAERRRRIEAGI